VPLLIWADSDRTRSGGGAVLGRPECVARISLLCHDFRLLHVYPVAILLCSADLQMCLSLQSVQMSAHGNAAKVAAAGAALLVATPAFAGDAGAGEKIFNANCAACHAGGQNSVVPDHTLEKSAIEKFLTGGFNEKAVVTQVTNGKNAMPAFGGRLSDDDIANVATYVISTSEAGWD
jgi:cytochrome c6